jgi:predicted transcriptional regulator
MTQTKLEKYVIIYQSQEHYEVLGYISAENIEDAIKRAKEELKKEAKFYDVEAAKIAKLVGEKEIFFDIE